MQNITLTKCIFFVYFLNEKLMKLILIFALTRYKIIFKIFWRFFLCYKQYFLKCRHFKVFFKFMIDTIFLLVQGIETLIQDSSQIIIQYLVILLSYLCNEPMNTVLPLRNVSVIYFKLHHYDILSTIRSSK